MVQLALMYVLRHIITAVVYLRILKENIVNKIQVSIELELAISQSSRGLGLVACLEGQ
jgi:hypothetical protein